MDGVHIEKWRVRSTHYASRSYFNGGPGYANPKSGIIDGSNDGITRTEIDRPEENSELNARGAIATFPIAERGSQWQMLRMPRKWLRFGFAFCQWVNIAEPVPKNGRESRLPAEHPENMHRSSG
jgi:hypothetical protein